MMSRQAELRENRGPYEEPDPTPVAIPAGARVPLTLEQQMLKFLRSQALQAELERRGIETEEEADDFDMPEEDDLDFFSNHEYVDMQEEGEPVPWDSAPGVMPERDQENEPAGDTQSEPTASEAESET